VAARRLSEIPYRNRHSAIAIAPCAIAACSRSQWPSAAGYFENAGWRADCAIEYSSETCRKFRQFPEVHGRRVGLVEDGFTPNLLSFVDTDFASRFDLISHIAVMIDAIIIVIEPHMNTAFDRSYSKMSLSSAMKLLHAFGRRSIGRVERA
jgi:hypothetical protein